MSIVESARRLLYEGLRLDDAWTKNRKEGFQPLPKQRVDQLAHVATGKRPDAPLLEVPTHAARALDLDLAAAGIPKRIDGVGKVDFHACRVAYSTFVVEAGANVTEAQTLLRHSTPQLTIVLNRGHDPPQSCPKPTLSRPMTAS